MVTAQGIEGSTYFISKDRSYLVLKNDGHATTLVEILKSIIAGTKE